MTIIRGERLFQLDYTSGYDFLYSSKQGMSPGSIDSMILNQIETHKYARLSIMIGASDQMVPMENTLVWAGMEPWLVELNRGRKGGEIMGVETNILPIGDGKPRLSLLVSLHKTLQFHENLLEIYVFNGGLYWSFLVKNYAQTTSDTVQTRTTPPWVTPDSFVAANSMADNFFLNNLNGLKSQKCEIVPGSMQTVQDAEIQDIYNINSNTANSVYGLDVDNEIRRIECELPIGFAHGSYNLTVIHRGFGVLQVSEHAWNAQTRVKSQPQQEKYMFRTMIRTETSGQHFISFLGGYLSVQSPGIALNFKNLNPLTLQEAQQSVSLEYENNKCDIVEVISKDEVRCYFSRLIKPQKKTYYAGNQGVSVVSKGCTKSFFMDNLASERVSHPTYDRKRISSFFESYRYPDSMCVRYQSILNFELTENMGFGMFCSPKFCRLQMSTYGNDQRQEEFVQIAEILDQTSTKHSEYFADFSRWTIYDRKFTENIDYLLDFQKFTDVYDLSTFSMLPWYPGSNTDICAETNDVEDMGLSRKPKQRIRIKYTGGGGGGKIIRPTQTYFTEKTRFVARMRLTLRNTFGIITNSIDMDLVLPDHCESTDKSTTPLYRKILELTGIAGAECSASYAVDGPNSGGVFQPDEKNFLTFDHPLTTKIIYRFFFPPIEYANPIANSFWSFDYVLGLPISPWAFPVYMIEPEANLKVLGSTQPRGKFTVLNVDSGGTFEVELDPTSSTPKINLSDLKTKIQRDARSEVQVSLVFDWEEGLSIYIAYMRRFKAPKYQIQPNAQMTGCGHRLTQASPNPSGGCLLFFEDLVIGDKSYLFTSPPAELLRTAHLQPQLVVKRDNEIMICESCDLQFLGTRQVPQVQKLEVNFATCELQMQIRSFTGFPEPTSVTNFTIFFQPRSPTSPVSPLPPLFLSGFQATAFTPAAPPNLSTLVYSLIPINTKPRFLNHITQGNFGVHYQSIGVFENNFEDFGPNFRLKFAGNPDLTGVGDWDGYGGIKVLDINQAFLVEWEFVDWVTTYPTPIQVTSTGKGPNFNLVQTFTRIKRDSSEDLEFFLGSTSASIVAPQLIINPSTFYINNLVKHFFVPGRYEHKIELTHATSACYVIEEKFIYDFVFQDQSFVIDINERFFLSEKLSFTLKNFVTREPDD